MTVRSLLTSAALCCVLALSTPAVAQVDPLAASGEWSIPERSQARTPPMGWNSWNAFRTEVDEAKVLGSAKAMVDSGLARLGYTYVNIDDGWWLKRRQTDGRLEIRTGLFPSAAVEGGDTSFRPYTDTLHAMGLKAGIYTDIGRNACSQAYDLHSPNLPEGTTAEREVGLQGHVDQDIGVYFREWGFDYIKVDACGINVYGPDTELVREHAYTPVPPLIDQAAINRTDVDAVKALYAEVAEALTRHNPDGDYILAICNWGSADVRSWGKDVGHMWRTSGDITPTWTRMLHNFDSASTRALYAKPGAWNDPDILFIGHGEFDHTHLTEARSHFSLWAMINAPLLISYDLRQAPQTLMDIWGNADIVGLNQDPGGHQGVIAYASDDVQILVKTLSNGRKAVALFNRGLGQTDVTLTAAQMKFAGDAPVRLRNLWEPGATSTFTGETSFTLEPRQTLVFEASGVRQLADGVYLSEIPGDVNVAVDGVIAPEPDPVVHRMRNAWGPTRGSGERPTYTGWGGAQADTTPYDQALRIGGETFETGIGVLTNSRLEVRNAGHTRFEARVGVDDSTRNTRDVVRFSVYGDGALLAETPPMRFGEAPRSLTADIDGVHLVEIVARSETLSSDLPLVVAWGDAALRR
ncbi:MAG: NPCBM/NEW2 domain-containing protein [Brevundimonas sp.]|uniref:NPCBM/NEW2 domain-containing protein n=1 Tax=Brevundimonas sp. TaxID=1871086 RepID=UPI00391C085E